MSKRFEIPSIEELVISQHNELIKYKKELSQLEKKNNPLDRNLIISMKSSISQLEEALSKYQSTIRDEKLKQIGI